MNGSYIPTQLFDIGHTHDTSSFMALKNKNGKNNSRTTLHFDALLKAAIPREESIHFQLDEKLHSIQEQESKLLQDLIAFLQIVGEREELPPRREDDIQKLIDSILQQEEVDVFALANRQHINQQVIEEIDHQLIMDQENSMKQSTLISNLIEKRMDDVGWNNTSPAEHLLQTILARLDDLLLAISSEEYRLEDESDHHPTFNILEISMQSMLNQEIENLLQQFKSYAQILDQSLSSNEIIHRIHAASRKSIHEQILSQQMSDSDRVLPDQEGRKISNQISSLLYPSEQKDVEVLKQRLLQWSQIREKLEQLMSLHKSESITSEKSVESKPSPILNKFSVLQQTSNYMLNNIINTEQITAERQTSAPNANNETSAPAARATHLHEDLKPILRNNLQFIRHDDVQQIRIRLIPEHLGHLDIRITAQDGKISATLLTSNYMAKEALELQIQQLRIALTQQGLNLEKIEISQQAHQHSNFEQQETHDHLAQHARKKEAADDENYEDVEEEVLATLDDLNEERSVINFIA